jgi:hypothetical protein
MADIIMTEATKQIELTCGLEARSSFTVGVQFRMINQVINKDGGRITTQSVKLIQRLLEKIDAAADLADYSTTMTDFIERFTARLDGIRGDEAAVSAECRRMWADMSKKMNTFDLAIDIVNR